MTSTVDLNLIHFPQIILPTSVGSWHIANRSIMWDYLNNPVNMENYNRQKKNLVSVSEGLHFIIFPDERKGILEDVEKVEFFVKYREGVDYLDYTIPLLNKNGKIVYQEIKEEVRESFTVENLSEEFISLIKEYMERYDTILLSNMRTILENKGGIENPSLYNEIDNDLKEIERLNPINSL